MVSLVVLFEAFDLTELYRKPSQLIPEGQDNADLFVENNIGGEAVGKWI